MRHLLISTTILSAALLMISPAQSRPLLDESQFIECDPGLGHLQTLRLDDIEAIDESFSISVWAVCTGSTDRSPLAGNVGGLHDAIAQNGALVAAVAKAGFRPGDVVAIRFGSGHSVIVYVNGSY